VGGFACLFIGKPLISFLYPDYLEASIVYLPITIGMAMVEVFYSFVWPIILRFGKSSSPMYITLIKAITYVSIAVRLSETHGIMGVCYAGLIGSLLQAGAVFVLGLLITMGKTVTKNDEKNSR
jgi:O-antigen/teichoic acid export membrane protein